MQAAGYELSWLDKVKLGIAKLLGQIEPMERGIPSHVHGVPTGGLERTVQLVEFMKPFLSKPGFGRDPKDIEGLLDAMEQKAEDVGGEQAKGLLQVYRRAMSRQKLFEDLTPFGIEDPDQEEPQGLMGIMQSR